MHESKFQDFSLKNHSHSISSSSHSSIPLQFSKHPPSTDTSSKPTLPIKRLTPTEMQARREQGLCFNCDEKYSKAHKCKAKFLLLTEEEDEVLISDSTDEDIHMHDDGMISYHALSRQLIPRTLRFLVKLIGNK